MMDGSSLRQLAQLLKPAEEGDSEGDEELDVHPSPYANPGSIGPQTKVKGKQEDGGAIWGEDQEEISEHQHYEYSDPRPQPEYEMVYQQAVSTEDVFLGMGNKNPTTASCEDLVVKIKLPDTNYSDVELDVTEMFLDCRTPKFRLGLHLPHKVDSKQSRARWLSKLQVLEVMLKLNRDYDCLNK